MKSSALFLSLMMVAGLALSGQALADRRHHGHARVGVYFGAPFPHYYYPFFPYDYYYPPFRVVAPPPPPVYIERDDVPPDVDDPASLPDNYYWYHCDKPRGYYPHVKACPDGWTKVVPTPPEEP